MRERDGKSDEFQGERAAETYPREQAEEGRAYRVGPALKVLVPMNLLMMSVMFVPGLIWPAALSTQFAVPAVFLVVMSNVVMSFYICDQRNLPGKQESEPDQKS